MITNYKVMYSTLMRQPHLRKQTTGDYIRGKDTAKKYFLIRNPYDRLESFYRDKFILYPNSCIYSENFDWQHCQKIFLNQYNIDKGNFEENKYALINTSFNAFINMLPSSYLLDGHLIPQTHASYYYYRGLAVKIKFDRVLQIEDEKNMLFLKNDLHIDTSIHENETKSFNISTVWNQALRKIVNSLYQSDFEELEYDMLHG